MAYTNMNTGDDAFVPASRSIEQRDASCRYNDTRHLSWGVLFTLRIPII